MSNLYNSSDFESLFDVNNIDTYIKDRAHVSFVKRTLPFLLGDVLDLFGSDEIYKPMLEEASSSYIRLGFSDNNSSNPDYVWNGFRIPCKDNSIDAALAINSLVHVEDIDLLLKEVSRVVKDNGVLVFSLPNIDVINGLDFRFTPHSIKDALSRNGLELLDLKGIGSWNEVFAHIMGLWLKRSRLDANSRSHMTKQLLPLYKKLTKSKDYFTDCDSVSVGWVGLARIASNASKSKKNNPYADINKVDGLCVANFHIKKEETFVEDHKNYLCDDTLVIYGGPPFLINTNRSDKVCLNSSEMSQFKQAQEKQDLLLAKRISKQAIQRYLLDKQVKVVMAEYGPIGVAMAPICDAIDIPLLVHFHGYDASCYHFFKRSKDGSSFYDNLYRIAKTIVVVSREMKLRLIEDGAPSEKIVINPCGVDVHEWDPVDAGKNSNLFLAVGRFVEKKGPALTIQAFSRVLMDVPDAMLVMVGSGELLEDCKKLASEIGVSGKVIFVGQQSREMVHYYMSKARAFIQHSLVASDGNKEGMPVAIMEAGSMGLPIVSTFHAGIPDSVRNGIDGILVEENDISGMAEGILRLAKNPDLATKMGASYRSRVCEQHRHPYVLGKLADALNSIRNS